MSGLAKQVPERSCLSMHRTFCITCAAPLDMTSGIGKGSRGLYPLRISYGKRLALRRSMQPDGGVILHVPAENVL